MTPRASKTGGAAKPASAKANGSKPAKVAAAESAAAESAAPKVRAPKAAASRKRSKPAASAALSRAVPDHGASVPEAEFERFTRGEHRRAWEILGAHLTSHDGVAGVRFAVWAPNARSVSVIGSFNRWKADADPMRQREAHGVWELFVAGVTPGALYKFHIVGWQGLDGAKCDPVGFSAELRPNTASVVAALEGYEWRDSEWLATRTARQALDRPMMIYEVHPGSWRRVALVPDLDGHGDPPAPGDAGMPGTRGKHMRDAEAENRFLTWNELAEQLIPYVKDLGYTHIELMPITEHPLDKSWGYQTIGYFAPTSRFGTPDEFRAFVDRAHQAGLGVILDWVPAHFPRDGHGLAFFDGTHLYEHADPRQGAHQEWGTLIFNYGRPQVADFLLSSAAYWVEQFHVDGLRVDAVASMLYLNYARKDGEWVANKFGGVENLEAVDFLRAMNEMIHERYPGVLTFAEESTSWPGVTRATHLGGLGFDLKWNLGWMHDNLDYMKLDPVFRRHHQDRITFSIWYAWQERWLLPLSHDEVVHGKAALVSKMPGDRWQRFATLRLLLAHMAAHPGKKLQFMGAEMAQWREWSEARQLDWELLEFEPHAGVHRLVRTLNGLVASLPPLHERDFDSDGFQWVDFRDVEQSVLAYVRFAKDRGDFVVAVNNYTPVVRHGYRLGVPEAGRYTEWMNTDAGGFGGSGVGNGVLQSEPVEWHGFKQSVVMTLPPLASVWVRRTG
jgi:1,4-alpha-glucan branching enzyme